MSDQRQGNIWSIVMGLIIAAGVLYAQHNDPLAADAAFLQRAVADKEAVAQDIHMIGLQFDRLWAASGRIIRID
ncbi:MAG: hypothetical protein KGJ78_08115 [Alphaproteobacteria bacterium]|nr:hypothetical protein [Alphaproteobacteria bacterium]